MHDRLAKLLVRDSGTSNLDGELGSCAMGLRTFLNRSYNPSDCSHWYITYHWFLWYCRWKRFVKVCCCVTSWLLSSGWKKFEPWSEVSSSSLRAELTDLTRRTMKMMIDILCCRRRSVFAVSARWRNLWTVWQLMPMPHRAAEPTRSWCWDVSEQCSWRDRRRVALCHPLRLQLSFTAFVNPWCSLLPYGYSYKASCARPG